MGYLFGFFFGFRFVCVGVDGLCFVVCVCLYLVVAGLDVGFGGVVFWFVVGLGVDGFDLFVGSGVGLVFCWSVVWFVGWWFGVCCGFYVVGF